MNGPNSTAPASDEAAFTLVETMFAIFILAVAILALAGVSATSLTAMRDARNRQEAVNIASAELEGARGLDFADLAMLDVQVVPAADPWVAVIGGDKSFAHDCRNPAAGCPGGSFEPLIFETAGGVDPYISSVGRFAVRTYVSWADAGLTQKRVTTVVTWLDPRQGAGEVRESTIVAEATRGLAAPDFEVRSLPAPATVPSGSEVCLNQTLVNLGERDRHDVTITQGDLAGVTTIGVDSGTHVQVGTWRVDVFVGTQPNPTPPPATVPRPATDSSGDLRPDSQEFLERNATLPLLLCYDVPVGATGVNTFQILVRSALAPTLESETFSHTITVGSGGSGGGDSRTLYLDFVDNTQAKRNRLHLLTAIAPTAGSLGDYDPTSGGNDTDADDLPGLRIARNTAAHTSRFDWQQPLDAPAILDGTGSGLLFSSWRDALLISSTTPRTLSYRLRIEKLNTARNVVATLWTGYVTYLHDTVSWEPVAINGIDFTAATVANRTINKNEWIRTTVECVDGTFDGTPRPSEADCHLAFDTTQQPSAFTLGFQP